MKTIFKQKQWVSVLLVVCLLFSVMIFEASAVDKNEVENNNAAANATVTYDDYNNYGYISTDVDVDWWKITVTSTGMANFWLGSVPSGCVFFMELYESDGSWKIAESKKIATSGQQHIRAKVYAGITYRIKIYSYEGCSTSDTYKFRVKNYTEIQEARIYTAYDYQYNGLCNFQENAPIIMNHTSAMGFNDIHRYNYTSTQVYDQLDDINLAVIAAHGDPGEIELGSESIMVANTVTYGYSYYKGIGQYAASALSEMKLICFESCKSGKPSSIYGNLVDSARDKGAFCALGWEESFRHGDILIWNDVFFEYLSYGYTVAEAIIEADSAMIGQAIEYATITSHYTGTSWINSLTLA